MSHESSSLEQFKDIKKEESEDLNELIRKAEERRSKDLSIDDAMERPKDIIDKLNSEREEVGGDYGEEERGKTIEKAERMAYAGKEVRDFARSPDSPLAVEQRVALDKAAAMLESKEGIKVDKELKAKRQEEEMDIGRQAVADLKSGERKWYKQGRYDFEDDGYILEPLDVTHAEKVARGEASAYNLVKGESLDEKAAREKADSEREQRFEAEAQEKKLQQEARISEQTKEAEMGLLHREAKWEENYRNRGHTPEEAARASSRRTETRKVGDAEKIEKIKQGL